MRRVLRAGDEVTVEGKQFMIAAISGSTATLADGDGTQACWMLSHLFNAVNGQGFEPALRGCRMVDTSPGPVLERARILEAHILEATTGNPREGLSPNPAFDPETTTQAERDLAKVDELSRAGAKMALRSWQRLRARYREQGVVGLVDERARRRVQTRVDPRVISAIHETVSALADDSTKSKESAISRVARKLESEHGPDGPEMPSRTVMYRLLDELSAGTGAFGEAPTRRSRAMSPSSPFGRTQAYRPGERVEIDSTRADFLVVNAEGRSVRPELTVAIDTCTRSILAADLDFNTDSADLSLLLAEIVAPRRTHPDGEADIERRHRLVPAGYRFADLETRLNAHMQQPVIVPEMLVADLGPPYKSKHFRRCCERLGISLEQARPRTPTDKPSVERAIGSINLQFCQQLPGYVGRSTTHRGRHIEGALTIEQAQDLLDEWVAVRWQRRPHDGLRAQWGAQLTPNGLAAHFYTFAGEVPVPLTASDHIELLPFKWVAVHPYGLNLNYRVYDSAALNPLRSRRNPDPVSAGKWALHYNPRNVFDAYLRGPEGWIKVEWTLRHLFSQPFGSRLWAAAKKRAPSHSHEEIARAALKIQTDLISANGTPEHDPQGTEMPEDPCQPDTDTALSEPSAPGEPMQPFDPTEWA